MVHAVLGVQPGTIGLRHIAVLESFMESGGRSREEDAGTGTDWGFELLVLPFQERSDPWWWGGVVDEVAICPGALIHLFYCSSSMTLMNSHGCICESYR